MVNFTPTTLDDQPQIAEWLLLDSSKSFEAASPGWWLTGTDCVVAFCLSDASGPTMYVRMDRESPFARMHTVFAPESQVEKKRLVLSLLEGFPQLVAVMGTGGFKGIVFESTSESLVKFMSHLGFVPQSGNDYVLTFEEK